MKHLSKILLATLILFIGNVPFHACSSTHKPPKFEAQNENSFLGKVVGVKDGDTIVVMHEGFGETIRLYGIDAPEKKQDYGTKSKNFLSDLVFNKEVKVLVRDKDRYGRTIGEVFLTDDRCVNQEIVQAGLAWWYEKYAPHDKILEQLQTEAQKNKIGLWSLKNPTPPWEFRKN